MYNFKYFCFELKYDVEDKLNVPCVEASPMVKMNEYYQIGQIY